MQFKTQVIRYLFASFLVMAVLPSFGQEQSNEESAQQYVELADQLYRETKAYADIKDIYMTAALMDPNNIRANYMSGISLLESVTKGAATEYFMKVYEKDPEYTFDLLYKIGQSLHYGYKFDEATQYYDRYLEKLAANPDYLGNDMVENSVVERKIFECEQGKILMEFPEDVEIENLGADINSPFYDYAPVVDADENIMIFTSRRKEQNLNEDVSDDNIPFEDIFISKKVNGVWDYPDNIGNVVNTMYHDSNVGLSKDGKELYIYKDENNGDIYVSNIDENGEWSYPEPLDRHINTDFSETSVSLSPDGNTMFFASDKPGGEGGIDIWISQRNAKGSWQKASNIGAPINTPYDEDGPFIGFDGKTLYFSSRGGNGMGGYDIYRVEYDSASQVWSTPTNMGYPINTPDDDIYFTPSKDGKRAYYASVKEDGLGFTDLYMLKVPDEMKHNAPKAEPVEVVAEVVLAPVTLTVTITGPDGIMDAVISLRGVLGTGGLGANKTATGVYEFLSTEEKSKEYALSVSQSGYESQLITINYPAAGNEPISFSQTVTMVKAKETAPVINIPKPIVRKSTGDKVRNVYFDFGSSYYHQEDLPNIEKAIEVMKKNTSLMLELYGHSDFIGVEKFNKSLSINRADKVKSTMIKAGIDAGRISIKGFGSEKPLATNDQEKEGRELNRRVEFRFVK
ncbi:Outer membrane lipoprotein omp16 precursor [hydrothermal vent metagenome]|uniref:Outer membrane lipoprotein omp16 n=1 Tax=hydrothermal vent metagenome TaxID=652676 RepID=A0A3B0U5V1_9ZZZZ